MKIYEKFIAEFNIEELISLKEELIDIVGDDVPYLTSFSGIIYEILEKNHKKIGDYLND